MIFPTFSIQNRFYRAHSLIGNIVIHGQDGNP
jgi:hypothetical protein